MARSVSGMLQKTLGFKFSKNNQSSIVVLPVSRRTKIGAQFVFFEVLNNMFKT